MRCRGAPRRLAISPVVASLHVLMPVEREPRSGCSRLGHQHHDGCAYLRLSCEYPCLPHMLIHLPCAHLHLSCTYHARIIFSFFPRRPSGDSVEDLRLIFRAEHIQPCLAPLRTYRLDCIRMIAIELAPRCVAESLPNDLLFCSG